MGDLAPIAFDIETNGLGPGSIITVAGLAFELGDVVLLNTAGRAVDEADLEARLSTYADGRVNLRTCKSERELLTVLADVCGAHIDTDAHYLTAYHGETWNGGFDLPFLRSACVECDVPWPFPDMAYADILDVVDRFETDDTRDLVGVYDQLIGEETCDPFDDSEAAITTFNNGEWDPLLRHNLADIHRTRELAVLAGEYVPKSDFRMKNLAPPR
jgi:uncharacterized protein YprB with RNaseH-like and TPR domain